MRRSLSPTESDRSPPFTKHPMSFAEVFARLGVAIVTWLCIYAWLVWTAVLRVAECDTSGDDLWSVVAGFGVLVNLLSPTLVLTRPLPDVHEVIRHLAWPLVVLVPLAAMPLWIAWNNTTIQGQPLCPTPQSAP